VIILVFMELRRHPAVSYRGIPSWPPTWTSRDGGQSLRGEMGILKYVYASSRVSDKCYLVIEHEGHAYVGCLLFSDLALCTAICNLLRAHIGRPIGEIGGLDVSHFL
jgi:hypothetical protein